MNIQIFKRAGKVAIVGGVAGGLAAANASAGFSRSEETDAGVKIGATVGLASVIIPKFVKSKIFQDSAKAVGRVVFRRIRGRIIAMRA